MLARRSASHPVGGFIARRSSCDAMGQELRPQDEAFVERLREKPWRGRLGKELMGRATQWLPGVPRLCLPVLSRRLVLNSVHRSEVSARLSFGVSIMEARFPLQDIDMQISPSSAEPRKGSRGPFSYQRKNTGSRSFPPRLSGKNTRSPANMATSVPMCPQALGRGCHALYPAGELCHRRLDMLTRSLLSAVFCLLPIILQPLPVAAESILLDGRMTTTTRPWLDKRARQWLDAREPLTIGVVSPDYPPLSIFYAGSYKGFTADYLALVFERPLRVRDFPSRQAAIAALSRGEIDLLGVGSEVEARQHGLLASAAYLSDRPVLVSSSGAPFDSQAESWLATVKGYLPAERIKAAYPHSKVIWFDSPQLALEALSMGTSMACWVTPSPRTISSRPITC